jgi:hypothetical protein
MCVCVCVCVYVCTSLVWRGPYKRIASNVCVVCVCVYKSCMVGRGMYLTLDPDPSRCIDPDPWP